MNPSTATSRLELLTAWFTNHGAYMKLAECMHYDTFWIALTLTLDFAVAAGYIVIARHWMLNERTLVDSPAKSALSNMKRIFIFCGLCGYLFIPIKMVWPAWRLYDAFLAVLVYYTWRYALSSRELRVVYEQLDRTAQLTAELQKSREDARLKSVFLSAISHDIRTPLNGLTLHAELAEMSIDAGDLEGARQSLAEIRQCASTGASLLTEFLEIGRIDWSMNASIRSPVALGEVAGRLIEVNRPLAARKGLAIRFDPGSRPIVGADPKVVERILQNLIENAIKYTTSGEVRVDVDQTPETIAVHVADTGIGIAEEHKALVFQDFYQVGNQERDRSKGFGLGLSIANRLAVQTGAELRLDSRLGFGSRFSLVFPASAACPPASVGAGGRDGDGDGSGDGESRDAQFPSRVSPVATEAVAHR